MTRISTMDILHIVNGDIVGEQLRSNKLEGRVLVWREMYTAGPLEIELEDRASWLEARFGIPKHEYIASAERQTEQYKQALQDGNRIAIWIDPDLFDQTILMKLCHLSMACKSNAQDRIELISLPAGPYSVKQLLQAWEQARHQLQPDAIAELADAWGAYASNDRPAIDRWLQTHRRKHAEVASALEFHLMREPGHDGLGIVERLTLRALADKESEMSKYKLFQLVSPQCPLFGMGDLQYWGILDGLASCEPPMIWIDSTTVGLTKEGREALSGSRTAPREANEMTRG
ncbi:DUF1835 domain-containing protein [Cohnella yongneupensis]|uniref:DUF1835 domain-containing protein n=1 Tax=Cohnella yongneupensis TaxID=425006 RepID=A0ABW0QZG2_9BACL